MPWLCVDARGIGARHCFKEQEICPSVSSLIIESLKHIADALSVPLRDLFEGEAFPTKEALVQLNRLCREREDEEIELILGIAQLIFERTRDRSRTP